MNEEDNEQKAFFCLYDSSSNKNHQFIKKSLKSMVPRILVLFEFGLVFGLQIFFVIFRYSILSNENKNEYFILATPLLLGLIVGFLGGKTKYRIKFRQMEWIFHLMTSLTALILVYCVMFNNLLSPSFPNTFSLFLWVAWFALLLTTYLIMHLDQPPLYDQLHTAPNRNLIFILFLALFLIICLALYELEFPAIVWIVSAVFHAIMIPISVHPSYSNLDTPQIESHLKDVDQIPLNDKNVDRKLIFLIKSVDYLKLYSRLFCLIIIFCLGWLECAYIYNQTETSPKFYSNIMNVFFSIPFWGGVILALFCIKFGLSNFSDLIIVGILAIGLLNYLVFAPFCVGYAFILLLLTNQLRNSNNQALLFWLLVVAWFGSLFLFFNYYDWIPNMELAPSICWMLIEMSASFGIVQVICEIWLKYKQKKY
jgi:hypothetical protein